MDLKFAFRSLSKNRGFTILAVLIMALGIGANTAVFSVVDAVLLRPLAYRNPERIVTISTQGKTSHNLSQVSAPDFHDWHNQSSAFDAMAYYTDDNIALMAGSQAAYAHAAEVTQEFFGVFDVEPSVGHFFTEEERKSGAVILSDAYWRREFGGNANAIGQTVRLEGHSLAIAGVAPPGFDYPNHTDLWIPANSIEPETTSRSAHNYLVIARLKPGISLGEAQAQMTTIAARLEAQYPSNKNESAAIVPMRDRMVSNVRLTLYLLLGAVALVLLIACANLANLLLARATGRTREIAIRAAVGATRSRIVRQMLTESGVLAIASAVAGLVLAVWGQDALIKLAPADIPRLAETGLDGGVLAFTLGISVLATILFGLAPAIQASRVDLNDALKQSGGRNALGGAGRLRAALVVAEVALSVMLVAGAGLLIRSFYALSSVELGFRPEKIVVMQTSVPAADLSGARRAMGLYKNLLTQMSTAPGVAAVSAARNLPSEPSSFGYYFLEHLPDLNHLTLAGMPQAVFSVVTPGYFQTMGIPLVSGRDFNEGDVYDGRFTVIVNQALAKKSFPGQDPIGHVIYCGFDSMNPMTVVGVVGDVRQWGPATPPWPELYIPYEQHPRPSTALSVLVRTSGDPGAISETMRRKLQELSPDVPVKFTTVQATLANSVATPYFRTLLVSIFAGLALILAMAGIYGVMAYVVGQRVSEIGLRMALGAGRGDVFRMVVGYGLKLAAIGLLLGLAGALSATRVLASMLFAVKPADPLTYAGVAVLLAITAFAACYLPARRAMKVDPLDALRQD